LVAGYVPFHVVKELFAQTNSEQTQHTQTHTHTHRDTQARNHDNNILLFFLQNPEKKAHIGVDKYRSVQHISVYESNALKLQKLFNVLNSESHRSAITRETTFSSNPSLFHSKPDSSYVRFSYHQTNQRLAMPKTLKVSPSAAIPR